MIERLATGWLCHKSLSERRHKQYLNSIQQVLHLRAGHKARVIVLPLLLTLIWKALNENDHLAPDSIQYTCVSVELSCQILRNSSFLRKSHSHSSTNVNQLYTNFTFFSNGYWQTTGINEPQATIKQTIENDLLISRMHLAIDWRLSWGAVEIDYVSF